MIEVHWPLDWPQGDAEVCDWLEALVKQYPSGIIFEYRYRHTGHSLLFTREEDAVAFRLRFGL